MTVGTLGTKGTRMYFADPASASTSDPDGVVIFKVACPTAIQGLGGAGDQINITCLDSTEMEYRRGMLNPGQITVPINFIARSASHQALLDLRESGTTISWMIVFSDQLSGPTTVDSDDRLVSPGDTSVEFLGYVADLNLDIGLNEIVRGTVTLQRSGAPVWDLPTADVD